MFEKMIERAVRQEAFTQRFWSKVDRGGECWVWTAGTTTSGYGVVRVTEAGVGKTIRAHRIAFVASGRRLAPGRLVMHSCDNPPCCNPTHLSSGTNADNSRDMTLKGRQARGETHGRAKLSARDAREIRRLRGGGATQAALAKRFGVAPSTISMILSRVRWRTD